MFKGLFLSGYITFLVMYSGTVFSTEVEKKMLFDPVLVEAIYKYDANLLSAIEYLRLDSFVTKDHPGVRIITSNKVDLFALEFIRGSKYDLFKRSSLAGGIKGYLQIAVTRDELASQVRRCKEMVRKQHYEKEVSNASFVACERELPPFPKINISLKKSEEVFGKALEMYHFCREWHDNYELNSVRRHPKEENNFYLIEEINELGRYNYVYGFGASRCLSEINSFINSLPEERSEVRSGTE